MTSCMQLFGIALAPLYTAIAQVESERGATSANVYQIKPIYIEDVNRISGRHYTMQDRFDRDKVEMMMYIYWEYYGRMYMYRTVKKVTMEWLAKCHNRGGLFWTQGDAVKQCATRYWYKVRKELK